VVYLVLRTVILGGEIRSYICRQGNVLEGVDRQARFNVLSTCEKVIGIVYDMKATKEDDGDYQFNLFVDEPYKRLLNEL
jgi:hypothetical protein